MSKNDDLAYTKGFIFGTLIGATVGAITALLLAPKTGEELRKDLAEKSKEAYNKASDMVNNAEYKVGKNVTNIASNVGTSLNESKMKAEEIINNAKYQANNLISDADNILKDARLKANQVKEATKAGIDTFKSEMKS